MTMERRENPRVSMALDATLYFNSLMLMECRTRDISLEGAFVETRGQRLPQFATVDLSINRTVEGQPHTHRLAAQVMRVEVDGVGLMFHYPDYASFSEVAHLLEVA